MDIKDLIAQILRDHDPWTPEFARELFLGIAKDAELSRKSVDRWSKSVVRELTQDRRSQVWNGDQHEAAHRVAVAREKSTEVDDFLDEILRPVLKNMDFPLWCGTPIKVATLAQLDQSIAQYGAQARNMAAKTDWQSEVRIRFLEEGGTAEDLIGDILTEATLQELRKAA